MKKLIFDFDGTIVESGPLIYSNLCEYTNNHKLTWDELKDLPSHEIAHALGLSWLDLPKLIIKIRNDFKLKLTLQPITPGIADALIMLKELGYSLHIVSSNSEQNISDYLSQHKLKHVISDVTSVFTIFGKARGIKKLLNKLQCPLNNAIYVGDETRDIQAARQVGIQSVAVTWGYNTERVLMTYHPDYIVKKPGDLVTVFSGGVKLDI